MVSMWFSVIYKKITAVRIFMMIFDSPAQCKHFQFKLIYFTGVII